MDDGLKAAREALDIDPDRSNIVLIVGTKGEGKSEAARMIFDQWPYDRLVLDVTGDARPSDPATIALAPPFPSQMPLADPEGPSPTRSTVWARVSPTSPRYLKEQDEALAMVLYPRHKKTLALVDEYGELATQHKWGGNTKLLIGSSRHYGPVSLVLCCPRPRFIPTATMIQADKVLMFDTPNEEDRVTVWKNAGYPIRKGELKYEETMRRGKYHYLLFDKHQKHLFGMPPLPIEAAHGGRS